jgi:hypothetical protein
MGWGGEERPTCCKGRLRLRVHHASTRGEGLLVIAGAIVGVRLVALRGSGEMVALLIGRAVEGRPGSREYWTIHVSIQITAAHASDRLAFRLEFRLDMRVWG